MSEAKAAARALELVKAGDWDGAHKIATDIDTPLGSRIHAHLHRVEGDLSNARYWYRRARIAEETCPLDEEWEKIAKEVT